MECRKVTETSAAPESAPAAPAPRRRHLPAIVRYPLIAAIGACVAALASYLLRTVGF